MNPKRGLGSAKGGASAVIAALLLLAAGCDQKKPDAAAAGANAQAECDDYRARIQAARKQLNAATENAPPPDAPIEVAVQSTEALAKAAKAVESDFAKLSPKRADIADSASGVKMLAGLAGDRLGAYVNTLRDFNGRLDALQKLAGAANDAAQKINEGAITSIGCALPKPGVPIAPTEKCAPIFAQLIAINRPAMPADFIDDAKMTRARADAFEALASAIEALPASPAHTKAREEVAKQARDAAPPFRALAKGLDEAAPGQDRLGKERQVAQETVPRLAAELEAAEKLCAPPGAASAKASASAPPAASGAPAAPHKHP